MTTRYAAHRVLLHETKGDELLGTKILLVEDDREIVHNLPDFLVEEGFQVASVSGQTQAIGYVEEHGVELDLVLMDVSLEEGNGFSACAAIKANSDIPVIFLTASGDEYSVVTGLDLGADDYIGKPFRPRELISRIRSVLRRCGRAQTVLELGDVKIDTAGGRRYSCLPWNTVCCWCLRGIGERFSPGVSCWRRFGMWQGNLSMTIP